MKKIFWNSWITNFLFSTYSTITLGPFVFTRYKKNEIVDNKKQYLINHECTHAQQWSELFILTAIILFFIDIFLGNNLNLAWYLFAPTMFYILYVIEHFVKMIVYTFKKECKYLPKYSTNKTAFYKAYRSLSYEVEARASEYDNNYLENRKYFGEFKFLFR